MAPAFSTSNSKFRISPTCVKSVVIARFSKRRSDAALLSTVALSLAFTGGSPAGGIAAADALLTTSPASTSACVTV